MRASAFAAVLAAAAPAAAQQSPAPQPPPARRLDFPDEIVAGVKLRPDGEVVAARRRASQPCLIRPRESFLPEMLRLAEGL